MRARLSNIKFMSDISRCYPVEILSQGLAVMGREKKGCHLKENIRKREMIWMNYKNDLLVRRRLSCYSGETPSSSVLTKWSFISLS